VSAIGLRRNGPLRTPIVTANRPGDLYDNATVQALIDNVTLGLVGLHCDLASGAWSRGLVASRRFHGRDGLMPRQSRLNSGCLRRRSALSDRGTELMKEAAAGSRQPLGQAEFISWSAGSFAAQEGGCRCVPDCSCLQCRDPCRERSPKRRNQLSSPFWASFFRSMTYSSSSPNFSLNHHRRASRLLAPMQ
jgi:hypothetical protein